MSRPYIIVAAVDLDGDCKAVLEQSLELAARHAQCEVHVVTVMEPHAPFGMYTEVLPPEFQAPTAERTRELCREAQKDRRSRAPLESCADMIVHVVVGFAADEIIWVAAHVDADVIVAATHGRRGPKRLLIGSVASKLVRLAGCPVFVVRDKTRCAPWRLPEIEPLCPDCGAIRASSAGGDLMCPRHRQHHVRAQVPPAAGARVKAAR